MLHFEKGREELEKKEKRKEEQTSQFLKKKFKFISNSDQNSGSET